MAHSNCGRWYYGDVLATRPTTAQAPTTGTTPTLNRTTATNDASGERNDEPVDAVAEGRMRGDKHREGGDDADDGDRDPLNAAANAPVVRMRSMSGAPPMMKTNDGAKVQNVAMVAPSSPQARPPLTL